MAPNLDLRMYSSQQSTSIIIIFIITVFNISLRWWSFTGDWVTVSLLKSPGLVSVFWPFSLMLLFGWSPHGRQLPNPPVPLIKLYLPCQKHQSQLVLLSPFFQFSSTFEVLISLFTFLQFYSVVSRDSKVDNFADFLFFVVVDYYKVWSSRRD